MSTKKQRVGSCCTRNSNESENTAKSFIMIVDDDFVVLFAVRSNKKCLHLYEETEVAPGI